MSSEECYHNAKRLSEKLKWLSIETAPDTVTIMILCSAGVFFVRKNFMQVNWQLTLGVTIDGMNEISPYGPYAPTKWFPIPYH